MALKRSNLKLDSPVNNFATLNPLDTDGSVSIEEGNLKFSMGSSYGHVNSNFFLTSGKWYYEVHVPSSVSNFATQVTMFGIRENKSINEVYYRNDGLIYRQSPYDNNIGNPTYSGDVL